MPELRKVAFLDLEYLQLLVFWGSVTLLDHQTTVEDVRIFSALPESQRERHIRLMVKRYQRRVTYCSMLEAIQYLKTGGGESQWM